jgi:hypothetical protein
MKDLLSTQLHGDDIKSVLIPDSGFM